MPFIHKTKIFPRLLFLTGIVACWLGNAVSAYAANNGNVAVCHIPPGNPSAARTINISMKTYEKSDKKHGYTLGECGSSSSSDTGTDNTVITTPPDSFLVIAKERDGDEVKIRSLTGEFISSFSTGGYGKDISVATGDFDGDGIDDVVVGLKNELKIFTLDGTELYSFKIRGEIKGDIAVGDLNGEGEPEIIMASNKFPDGNGYIYAADGTELDTIELFGKEKEVSLASADVTGDGMDDIIGGGGIHRGRGHKGQGDKVTVYNVATLEYVTFSIFDEEPNKGKKHKKHKKHKDYVNVAAGNVVGDDTAEIVVATAKKGSRVEIYSGDGTFIKGFEAFDGKKGIIIAVGDVSGDAHAEIIVAEPESDEIRIFDADGKLLARLPGLDIKRGQKKGKGKGGKIVSLAVGQSVPVTVDDGFGDDIVPGDTETGDTGTSDTGTGDTETGDRETGVPETGDIETANTETGDTETGDIDIPASATIVIVQPDQETVLPVGDGLVLTIPKGAVVEPVTLWGEQAGSVVVRTFDENTVTVIEKPGLPKFTLGPDGTNFSIPVTVTLSYDPNAIAEGFSETNLTIIHERVVVPTEVDTVAHTVSAQLDHFSSLQLGYVCNFSDVKFDNPEHWFADAVYELCWNGILPNKSVPIGTLDGTGTYKPYAPVKLSEVTEMALIAAQKPRISNPTIDHLQKGFSVVAIVVTREAAMKEVARIFYDYHGNDFVERLTERGVIKTQPDLRLDDKMDRAQLAELVYNARNHPFLTFDNVPENQ